MTTSVTITGSGTPIPSAARAGPGTLVRHGDLALQFDAGRATVPRLAACGLWPTDLDAVFITHHHSDHLTALQDLVLTRWVMDRDESAAPLPIVAPDGPAVHFADRLLDLWADDVAVRMAHSGRRTRPALETIGFACQDEPVEVWVRGDVRVSAGRVRHEPVHPSVGYRVDTPDGSIAMSGDTLVCDEVAVLAEGVDILVYEAMRFAPIEALPAQRRFILDYHADTRLIGAQAAELGVGTLVLTHLIPEPTSAQERQAFVDDIRGGGFGGDLVVADDLDTVTLG